MLRCEASSQLFIDSGYGLCTTLFSGFWSLIDVDAVDVERSRSQPILIPCQYVSILDFHIFQASGTLTVMTSSKHDVYQQSKLKFVCCLVRVSFEPTRLPETSGIVLVGLRLSGMLSRYKSLLKTS